MTVLDHLPAIDWESALKLSGNNRMLAEDMVSQLLKNLPDDIDSIKQLYRIADYQTMRDRIHKLRGGVSYCGMPRLKIVLTSLETDLKNHIMVSLPSLLDQLDIEVTLLLEAHNNYHSKMPR
jgi:two-component system sensor histidine kinase BarA